MLRLYKIKISKLLVLLISSVLFLTACQSSIPPKTTSELDPPLSIQTPSNSQTSSGEENPSTSNGTPPAQNGSGEQNQTTLAILSVHYLDVGQGDCILICFPDGKSMMIDCGTNLASSIDTIKTALNAKEITALNYLILTHPDYDHIGGVKDVLGDVTVEKVYHPEISEQKAGFDDYFGALQFLTDKGAQTEVSAKGECFGEDYKVAILSQVPRKRGNGAYKDFHLALEPTESHINNLSPYVYLEYKGYRFLFTGDADKQEEASLINDYNSGLLKKTFSSKGLELKLEEIDFLKIAHHGSDDSSSQDFLNLLKPKYAVISVGGNNSHGHPATSTQYRLLGASENVEILRTDYDGSISVFINSEGKMEINTSKENNKLD